MSSISCSARSHLRRALLDVGPVELLDVRLLEHGGHRLDRLELGLERLEVLVLVEHAGAHGGLVRVVREDVPAAEHDVVELGERDVVLDRRRVVVGALADAGCDPIWVSEPIGLPMPLRIACTPAMNVVATAPIPGSRMPSLPLAGLTSTPFFRAMCSDSRWGRGEIAPPDRRGQAEANGQCWQPWVVKVQQRPVVSRLGSPRSLKPQLSTAARAVAGVDADQGNPQCDLRSSLGIELTCEPPRAAPPDRSS